MNLLLALFEERRTAEKRTNDAVWWLRPRMLLSGRTALYLHGGGHENNHFQQIKSDEATEPHHLSSYISVCVRACVCEFSSVQFHFLGGKKFLNVCFKDSSSTFQVFGCFFSLCVEVHSFSRTFASPKRKMKKKKRLFMLWIQHTGLAERITTAK